VIKRELSGSRKEEKGRKTTERLGRVSDLALLLPIREVSGSNLGPETGYTDRGYHDFPQSLQENAGVGISN
jgi:hypothetical protein